jgi:hypothetical protein
VRTFTYDAELYGVALETLSFEGTRLHSQSLCDSFEARHGWLASCMDVGVNEGYAKLDAMVADGNV